MNSRRHLKANNNLDARVEADMRGVDVYTVYRERMPDIKERILAFVTDTDMVSFAQLCKLLTDEERMGDIAESSRDLDERNIFIWAEMSKGFAEAVGSLIVEKKIFVHPCKTIVSGVPMVYLIDGCLLNMPLARRYIHYKKPHWLPVVLSRRPPK